MKRLPDAEFEVMKAIWSSTPPVTTKQIASILPSDNDWKPQTILTLLVRLTEKGFVDSKKQGKERLYYPLVTESEYLTYESQDFMNRFHKHSFSSLVSAFYKGKGISESDLDELENWLKERRH